LESGLDVGEGGGVRGCELEEGDWEDKVCDVEGVSGSNE